jgi:hypothetical protein
MSQRRQTWGWFWFVLAIGIVVAAIAAAVLLDWSPWLATATALVALAVVVLFANQHDIRRYIRITQM